MASDDEIQTTSPSNTSPSTTPDALRVKREKTRLRVQKCRQNKRQNKQVLQKRKKGRQKVQACRQRKKERGKTRQYKKTHRANVAKLSPKSQQAHLEQKQESDRERQRRRYKKKNPTQKIYDNRKKMPKSNSKPKTSSTTATAGTPQKSRGFVFTVVQGVAGTFTGAVTGAVKGAVDGSGLSSLIKTPNQKPAMTEAEILQSASKLEMEAAEKEQDLEQDEQLYADYSESVNKHGDR